MYGPPGCGKTFIVKAAAGECQAGFLNAKLSDLLDMYVGNTEKNIHKVFELARKNPPCLLFFDEVEAIGGRRDQGEGQQYMKMAVNQMLYEMDGVDEALAREAFRLAAAKLRFGRQGPRRGWSQRQSAFCHTEGISRDHVQSQRPADRRADAHTLDQLHQQ